MGFAHSGGIRHPALLRHTSSAFEDPFAEQTLAQYNQLPSSGDISVDQNHKLLSFSNPYHNLRLYNDSYHGTSVDITAQLQGNFYLGEPQWSGTPDTPPPPPELTCYRRNLFSIDGQVRIPRNLRYVWTDDGNRIPLMDLELNVSAIESVEGNTTKLISVPFKGPSAGSEAPKADEKGEKEPTSIVLDPTTSSDLDGEFTTLPFHWKRLQFRSATQNNGRRKELQQHFVLKLKVVALLVTGGRQVITECQSGAIIVRGRSPRNFASRNDIPLTTGSASRRSIPSIPRSGGPISLPRITSQPRAVTSPPDEVPQTTLKYENSELHTPAQEYSSQPPMMIPEPLPTPTYTHPLMVGGLLPGLESGPDFPQGNPFIVSPNLHAQSNTGPQSLHFDSDHEGSPVPRLSRSNSRAPTSNPSPLITGQPRALSRGYMNSPPYMPGDGPPSQRPRLLSHQPSSGSIPQMASAAPNSMALNSSSMSPHMSRVGTHTPHTPSLGEVVPNYSYVPLPPEDWQEPVSGFYAPHGESHHGPWTTAAGTAGSGTGQSGGRSSSKRYFAQIS